MPTRFILASFLVALGLTATLAFPLPPLAPKKDVTAIVREFAVPQLHSSKVEPTPIEGMVYFAAALKQYEADASLDEIRKPANSEKYPLRLAVLDAIGTLRDLFGKDWFVLRKEFSGPLSVEVKKQIAEEQLVPARVILKLEIVFDRLEAVEPQRANELRRWQAHYDLAVATCLARLAFLHEYNMMLGQIRLENLPDLNAAKGENAYRLVSANELKSTTSVKKLAERSSKLFDQIVEEHRGTPWAIAAAREKAAPLGLRWEGFVAKMKE